MTKLTSSSFAALAEKEDGRYKAVLFYGQDEGLVEECREKMTAAVVPDARDPFRITDLTQAQVKEDPARLYDEANAISLMGGRRVIRMRGVDNNLTPVMKEFLETYKGDALVVLTAGNLAKSGSLPSLFEKSTAAAVLPCYSDEGAGLKQFVFRALDEQGFSIDPDALAFIADNLGADRMVSRSELAKLAAYMGTENHITLKDAEACIGDASALSVDRLVYALAEGNQPEMNETLTRLYAEGQAPIVLLRAASMHFRRLHVTAGKIKEGQNMETAMRSLYPPVHFKRADSFKRQLKIWSAPKITRALALLMEAERECKRPGRPPELLCSRVFLQIAAQAKRPG